MSIRPNCWITRATASGNQFGIRQVDDQSDRITARLPALIDHGINACFIAVEGRHGGACAEQG
jgi:hypothetical protein